MLIAIAALAVAAVTPFLGAPSGEGLASYEEAPLGDEAETQENEAD
ncbi:MAG TPA: hypothetical protein PLS69_07105 [Terricaulis sp.]|nr:hypothetical protein [Terricaulis sp.]